MSNLIGQHAHGLLIMSIKTAVLKSLNNDVTFFYYSQMSLATSTTHGFLLVFIMRLPVQLLITRRNLLCSDLLPPTGRFCSFKPGM
jgi:hypothetical protein